MGLDLAPIPVGATEPRADLALFEQARDVDQSKLIAREHLEDRAHDRRLRTRGRRNVALRLRFETPGVMSGSSPALFGSSMAITTSHRWRVRTLLESGLEAVDRLRELLGDFAPGHDATVITGPT
jgi:hypothetical protein